MMVEEIKPLIDHDFRTLPDAMNTGVGGSSLGGLLSLHLGLTYPHVFGKLALLSPSVWWVDRWIVRQLSSFRAPHETLRIWLDVGTGETRMLKGARLLYRTLVRRGWTSGVDLQYLEAPDALHDEHDTEGLAEVTHGPVCSLRLSEISTCSQRLPSGRPNAA